MITIVTSAYNAQSTIGRAIESVQSQSFKDWEMIIVNDCSTDNTAEIIKSYAEKDARIRIINHDINKGAGLARRTGISHIKGEYMTFLDSDDYLKPDCLEILHWHAINYDVDIVSQGYIMIKPNGEIIQEKTPSSKVIQVDGAKFKPNKEDTKRFMNPMLIKSSLWDKVTYSARRFIEDTPTLVQILYWARNIMLIDYTGYYYVQNSTSLVHSANELKHLIYQTLSIKDMALFFKSVGKENLSNNTQFKKQYTMIQGLCTKDDRIKYKSELEELKTYYKTLRK
jgi:glycosyltransferase involved in cell wall biosynthesis